MSDFVRLQGQGVPQTMRTRYRDMGDGSHALVGATELIHAATGNPLTVDLTGALVTIDYPHHEIHAGNYYSVSYRSPDDGNLADNGSIAYALTTGSVYAHLIAMGACGGDAELALYEAPDISAGTPVTPLNHNRISTHVSTVTVVRDPTVNDTGDLLDMLLVPGGTGGNAIGSTGNQREEWILAPATVYLVRIINRAGNAQPASLKAEWYEENME